MRNGPEKIKEIIIGLTPETKNKTILPKAPQMGVETRWRPTPLRRVLCRVLPMVPHSGPRHDSLEAREKAKEYRRKIEKQLPRFYLSHRFMAKPGTLGSLGFVQI